MKRAFLVAAIAIIVSSAGHAQQPMRLNVFMTILEKQGLASEGSFFDHIAGAGRGFVVANEHLRQEKERPLYCPPGQLALNGRNYVDIAVQEYKRHASIYDNLPPELSISPAGTAVIMLLRGLRETFPCK